MQKRIIMKFVYNTSKYKDFNVTFFISFHLTLTNGYAQTLRCKTPLRYIYDIV